MGEMVSEPAAVELRCARRQRLLKDGRIVLHRGWSLIDCAIRDASATGARLSVKPNCELPQNFDLLYVTEEKLVPCELRWRRGDRLGVRFSGAFRKSPPYRL
ncbi:MAG: PilZ domain-containing protein [Aestuariivirgaceae bacterium]